VLLVWVETDGGRREVWKGGEDLGEMVVAGERVFASAAEETSQRGTCRRCTIYDSVRIPFDGWGW
jgi:hypothetical protein